MDPSTCCLRNISLLENHQGSKNEPSSKRSDWEPRYFPMEALLPWNHPASYFYDSFILFQKIADDFFLIVLCLGARAVSQHELLTC